MRRILLLAVLMASGGAARADLLTIINGDRYHGAIELVNDKEVHLKSEILGLIKIPRAKVSAIQFGDVKAAETKPAAATTTTSGKELVFDPKAIEKVQQEFLGTATPEANDMFAEMLQGLSSGKINVEDIRTQARETLQQLKELQSELGEEADNPLLSTYSAILERFVRAGGTNAPSTKSAPKLKLPITELEDE